MAADFEMHFTFEGEEYRLPTLMLVEARAIQKATGLTPMRFFEALAEGDADAITGLVWVARKRREPTLRFDDVDGDLATFKQIEDDDDQGEQADEEGKDLEPSPTEPGPSITAE